MTGSSTTTAPATAGSGRHRSPMSWASKMILLTVALVAVFALPGMAKAAGPAATIDQCRNGSFSSPQVCIDGNFQNGNLGGSNSHYREGESVPFRALISGLGAGASTGNTLVIQYDTLQGADVHAYDYLTAFDRTETTANPVHDVSPAPTAGNCFPIPADPGITFPIAGATQAAGCIKIWNGQ